MNNLILTLCLTLHLLPLILVGGESSHHHHERSMTTSFSEDLSLSSTTTTRTNSKAIGGGGERTCFSGHDTIQLESGEHVTFSKLRIGDRILTSTRNGEISYSSVIFLPHGENDTPTTFLEIITLKYNLKIKMTKGHLILTCNGDLIPSHELTKKASNSIQNNNNNNCIQTIHGKDYVKSIRPVHSKGVYTAVTEKEYLIVNDIIVSPFAISSGLVHAYYNITDIKEWCSSNNWLLFDHFKHPENVNNNNNNNNNNINNQQEDTIRSKTTSLLYTTTTSDRTPSSDCIEILTNMFEEYKDEPIGWGINGWGYRGWANPSSIHQDINHHIKTVPPPPKMIVGWD
mmetsp:Transcript_40137/g.51718  ORF Transcript_40137/g.51718 Transcript_40137/m.51718 type:complete len:343 (-) Transcript_40137:168-1196(-)